MKIYIKIALKPINMQKPSKIQFFMWHHWSLKKKYLLINITLDVLRLQ